MRAVAGVWVLLARRRGGRVTGGRSSGRGGLGHVPSLLAVVAFAAATWAALAVASGTYAFVQRAAAPGAGNDAGIYPMLATISCVLLSVPVATLGAAAARLTVARRNVRLARLRLVGATTSQAAALALLDAALEAGAGALTGTAAWLLSLPGLARLHFQGRPFAVSELVLPAGGVLLAVLAVLVVALISCAASLRRVAITPLGVTRRVTPKALSLLRAVPLVVLTVGFVGYYQYAPGSGQGMLAAVVLLGLLGGAFAVYNLLGPLLVGLVGRLLARTATAPATLLAARRLVDDPRSSWRSVGGIALVTFVAGLLSIAPGMQAGQGPDRQDQVLADLGTGTAVTLAIAALMAAVSTGVTQAARVLDQAPQYRALHLGGADLAVLHAARARETWIPLLVTVGGAAATSLVLISPFAAILASAALAGIGLFVATAGGGAALVLAAARASRPLVAAVARADTPR